MGFNKPKETGIILDIPKDIKIKSKNKDLQRTEKWMQDRLGRWTASQLKNLMSCNASGGKISWKENSKVFLFGATALSYIYENAMERRSGKYIEMGHGTKEMRYGTKVEPLILKVASKRLKKMGVEGKVKPVGFKQFPTMPNAGVSSDSILFVKKEPQASVEAKACTSWNTHFERTFEFTSDKSKDFWQTQGQMLAWNTPICYYVVAEPPKNIEKYLYHDGDIMDLYKDFKKECPVNIEIIKESKIHQEALLKRICIAEDALNQFLKTGKNLKHILYETIDIYKQNPEKLTKYIE